MILIFSIIGILAFSEPKILLIILLIFSLPVIFFLTYFKKTLKQKGEIAKKSRILILKNLQESFSLIKFIKIIGNQEYIKKNFELQNFRSLHQETIVAIIGRTPRIILELVTVLSISLIILFLFRSGQSFESMIPLLTLLVVSLVRFIPSVGIILVDINQYKFHHVSLSNIYNIFKYQDEKIKEKKVNNFEENINKEIFLKKDIQFFDVDFSYPDSIKSGLKNLSFVIKKNSKTGIKGPTGSGKSTLIALLLGLLKPDRGEIKVDNDNIHRILEVGKGIGYVPQTIHLLDDTIKKYLFWN